VTIAVRRWRTLFALVLIEAAPIGVMRAASPASGPFHLVWLLCDVLLVGLLYPAALLTVTAPSPPPPGAVLKAAVPRFGASLVTFLLSAVWFALWLCLSAAAGGLAMLPFLAIGQGIWALIAAAVVAGGTGLALLPRAGLVGATLLPIVILERCSPWTALSRARQRVNHAGFLRSSLLGLALFAVSVVPILLASSAIDALIAATKFEALRALDELISDALSLGLGVVLGTVAALDLRARFEGVDLEAELDAAAPQ
jgi:hypothetical protein